MRNVVRTSCPPSDVPKPAPDDRDSRTTIKWFIPILLFLTLCSCDRPTKSSQSEITTPTSGSGVGIGTARPDNSNNSDNVPYNHFTNRRKHTFLHPYISSIDANLDSVKFFEGQYYPPNKDQRQYRTGFDRRSARYINWEINLTHKPPGQMINYQLSAEWFRNGKLFFRDSGSGRIEPNWEYSYNSQSYNMNPWVPGLYRVDIYINGNKVTSAMFDVYNANCEGELTFPGADRVEELRRNAEANGYSGSALYQFVAALHNRGGQCFLNGHLDAAYQDFSEAIQYHPKFDMAFYHRGLVLLHAGKPKEALADLDQAISYYQSEDYYEARGRAQFALENDSEALSDLNRAIQLNQKRAGLYHVRGVIYYYLGNDQNAVANLRKAAQIYKDQDQEKYKIVSSQIDIIEGRAQGYVEMNDDLRRFNLASAN